MMDIKSLVVISLGILLAFVGFFVQKKKTLIFITRNQSTFIPKNEKKLANRLGLVILIFGLEMAIFPVVYQVFEGVEGYHLAIFAFFHFFLLLGTMIIDQLEM